MNKTIIYEEGLRAMEIDNAATSRFEQSVRKGPAEKVIWVDAWRRWESRSCLSKQRSSLSAWKEALFLLSILFAYRELD